MGAQHPSHVLFEGLRRFTSLPAGVVPIEAPIKGTSFFPAGTGLVVTCPNHSLPKFPVGGVMILAHDWGTTKDYAQYKKLEAESLSNPTWRRMLAFFDDVGIDRGDCFFTNFFVGLRTGRSSVGRFPGASDAAYVAACRAFVVEQIELQRPKIVLVFGCHVPRHLALGSEDFRVWQDFDTFKRLDGNEGALIVRAQLNGSTHRFTAVSLVHPSYRHLTARHRRWKDLSGDEAEIELVKHALSL